jgi:hypothetical protein
MKKSISIMTIIILCIALVGCKNKDSTLKDIKADSYNISYEDSLIYNSKGIVDKSSVESLVKQYNIIELTGATEQQVNWENSVCIVFFYKNKKTGQIYIYDNGICSFNGLDNYTMSDDSNIYDDAIKAHKELKNKSQSLKIDLNRLSEE